MAGRSMRRLIGNTPLLSLALHILQRAYETRLIAPGDPIAEATSGNTGISFAAIGRAMGHPVTVFMPDWMSTERIALISSFGASVVLVSKADGGFLGSIARADAMKVADPRTFLPHQFSNEANIDAHFTGTGPEIWLQLQGQGLTPDAFVAGVGTGGTVMGVGRYLKSRKPSVTVHPLEHTLHGRRRQAGQLGRLLRPRVRHAHAVVRRQPPPGEQPRRAGLDRGEHVRDVGRGQIREGVKRDRPRRTACEDAVEHERLYVDVQIERAANALHHGHRPAARVRHTAFSRPDPQVAEARSEPHGHDGAAPRVIPREAIAQPGRQAQHPLHPTAQHTRGGGPGLPHGHVREHMVHQMRGPLGHAAPGATGTAPASCTGERHEPIEAAGLAANPRDPARQPAAAEEVAALLLDEPRQAFAIAHPSGLRTERVEVIADDAGEHTPGGTPRFIPRRRHRHAWAGGVRRANGALTRHGRLSANRGRPRDSSCVRGRRHALSNLHTTVRVPRLNRPACTGFVRPAVRARRVESRQPNVLRIKAPPGRATVVAGAPSGRNPNATFRRALPDRGNRPADVRGAVAILCHRREWDWTRCRPKPHADSVRRDHRRGKADGLPARAASMGR